MFDIKNLIVGLSPNVEKHKTKIKLTSENEYRKTDNEKQTNFWENKYRKPKNKLTSENEYRKTNNEKQTNLWENECRKTKNEKQTNFSLLPQLRKC